MFVSFGSLSMNSHRGDQEHVQEHRKFFLGTHKALKNVVTPHVHVDLRAGKHLQQEHPGSLIAFSSMHYAFIVFILFL